MRRANTDKKSGKKAKKKKKNAVDGDESQTDSHTEDEAKAKRQAEQDEKGLLLFLGFNLFLSDKAGVVHTDLFGHGK